jgi:hypothetical protein
MRLTSFGGTLIEMARLVEGLQMTPMEETAEDPAGPMIDTLQ